jgi:hypothetical protein
MYLDSQTLLTGGTANPNNSAAGLSCQNLAQVAGTYLGGNVLTLTAPGTDALGNTVRHDIGQSNAIVDCRVVTTFASGGAATLQVALVNDAVAALNSGTADILDETQAIALGTLVAGYRFRLTLVPPQALQQYLGLKFIIGTATTTAGLVEAKIVPIVIS